MKRNVPLEPVGMSMVPFMVPFIVPFIVPFVALTMMDFAFFTNRKRIESRMRVLWSIREGGGVLVDEMSQY